MPINGNANAVLPPGWHMMPDGTLQNDNGQVGEMRPDGQVMVAHQNGFIGADGKGMLPTTYSQYDPSKQPVDGDTGNEANITQLLGSPGSANYNAFSYRGDPAAATRDVNRDRWLEGAVQQRQGVVADMTNANASRGLQQQAASGYASMLAGGGPSLANQTMLRGTEGALGQSQMAAAQASHGSMAGAQRNALMMGGVAANGGAAAGVSQRMNEQGLATQGLMGTAGQMYQGDAATAQQQAALQGQQRGLNDAASRLYGSQALDVRNAEMQGGNARQNAENTFQQISYNHDNADQAAMDQKRKEQVDTTLGVYKTALMAAGMASDERMKDRVGDGSAPTREMLDRLEPKTYWYKSGNGQPEGERLGIMAQDLEASKLGRSAVHEGPDGFKRVDIPGGLGLAMAGLAEVNKRLRRVEGGK